MGSSPQSAALGAQPGAGFFTACGVVDLHVVMCTPRTMPSTPAAGDATNRSANRFTLTIKTASGTGLSLPVASTSLVYADGTNINLGLRRKGYITTTGTYTAVADDQVLVDTSSSTVTINLPASPSVGDEVHFIDSKNFFASNNLTVGRNGSNILGAASNLTVNTNGAAFTLVFVNATRGWAYKTKI